MPNIQQMRIMWGTVDRTLNTPAVVVTEVKQIMKQVPEELFFQLHAALQWPEDTSKLTVGAPDHSVFRVQNGLAGDHEFFVLYHSVKDLGRATKTQGACWILKEIFDGLNEMGKKAKTEQIKRKVARIQKAALEDDFMSHLPDAVAEDIRCLILEARNPGIICVLHKKALALENLDRHMSKEPPHYEYSKVLVHTMLEQPSPIYRAYYEVMRLLRRANTFQGFTLLLALSRKLVIARERAQKKNCKCKVKCQHCTH